MRGFSISPHFVANYGYGLCRVIKLTGSKDVTTTGGASLTHSVLFYFDVLGRDRQSGDLRCTQRERQLFNVTGQA